MQHGNTRDPLVASSLGVLDGSMVAHSSGHFVLTAAARRGRSRFAIDARWLACIVLSLASVLSCGGGAPHPTPAELELMKADGDRIRALVESERARIGRVPATIDTRSDCPFIIRRGGWIYATLDGGAEYTLSVGDYSRDGLELYWESDPPQWIVDT